MPRLKNVPDLKQVAASELAELLEGVAVEWPLPIDPSSEIGYTLELLIPKMLRRQHPEWLEETIDGFFYSSAVKSDERSAELAGTCILMSDQTVTPFRLNMRISDAGAFEFFRIRLGEAGEGRLGISGPPWRSSAARALYWDLNTRLEEVAWVYDLTV
jgi:hypothetical protein